MGATKKSLENVQWDALDLQPKQEEQVPMILKTEVDPKDYGLEPVKANEMVSGLNTILAEREVLSNAYCDVIGLDINSENLPTFKELRLKIVKNRTQGLDKWKEREKAFYLAGGNFIQAIYNRELRVNQDMESKLMDAEKYFENLEKEKKRQINLERIERIKPYIEDAYNIDFSEMSDYDFDDFVLGKKTRFENEQKEREAEAKKIEAERLAEIERQKAIEAENAKLKKEAEEKERLIAIERAELNAKLEAERLEAERLAKIEADKKAKLEAELNAKLEAERKLEAQRLAEIEAKKKEAEQLAKAGVNAQLTAWIDTFSIEIPDHLKSNKTANEVLLKFESFKSWSKNQIK